VLLTLHLYALDGHILSDVTNPSVYWARLDSIVVTWILGTFSPELHEIVREPTETARQAWLVIESQFLGNSESHVLQLDARFCAFKQGDLSISDYCRHMKGMTVDLRALGETITDCHVVLNLLQDLNKRFDHMKIFIKWSQSFPSFHTVRNDLEIEEIELDHSAAQGQASTFYSAPSGGGRPPQQQQPLRPPQQEPPCPQAALPLLFPTPTMAAKARARARRRGRGKARTTALVALATTAGAPRRGPPSIIPGPAPSRCGQGCVLLRSSRHIHYNTLYSLHRCTTVLLVAPPSSPYR
jgi:hypothetical protein